MGILTTDQCLALGVLSALSLYCFASVFNPDIVSGGLSQNRNISRTASEEEAAYRYRLSHGPRTGSEFEAQAAEIPQVSKGTSCTKCHLNRACFNYSFNVWHPSRCPSRNIGRDELSSCLDGEKTVLLLGDSRMIQLTMEVAALADPDTFLPLRSKVDTADKRRKFNVLLMRKDREKEEGSLSAFELGHGWNMFRWGAKSVEPFVDDLALRKGRKYLVLAGSAPWTLKPPLEVARNASLRLEKTEAQMKGLREILELIEEKKPDDMEVILLPDTLPLPTGEQGLTSDDSQVLLSGVAKLTLSSTRMALKDFPFVKVMDSPLYANEAYFGICKRKQYRQHSYQTSGLQGISFAQTSNAWFCENRWHPGRVFHKLVANLLLNHVC